MLVKVIPDELEFGSGDPNGFPFTVCVGLSQSIESLNRVTGGEESLIMLPDW